jgi:GMP synthase (glutamine-hydrolysing)
MHQRMLILDFGSQYTQLIARRLREQQVYCEILPFSTPWEEVKEHLAQIKGIIFSGSPASVRQENAPRPQEAWLNTGLPILGICYGAQWMAQYCGGQVEASKHREYGRSKVWVERPNALFEGLENPSQVWMSHADSIVDPGPEIEVIARTEDIPVAAYAHKQKPWFGLQFHPEVYHSTQGSQLLKNFLFEVCGCTGDWTPGAFIEETIASIQDKVGDAEVAMALSGGVDSTVAATLIHKAIGSRLHCFFVDHGLLRLNEGDQVMEAYRELQLPVKRIDAKDLFLNELKGVSDPEEKRKIIGRLFIELFDKESSAIEGISFLGQGTIYPDVIESVSVNGPSVTIKSHHNVGGLPEKMKLKVLEPLRSLFKDEVRRMGQSLGIPEPFLQRHPFPGPGLAIRMLGAIDEKNLEALKQVDHIFIEGLKSAGLYHQIWQAGAIFLPVKSVGVMGDERSYEHAVALRAVSSTDGMTADWVDLPYDFMRHISNRIINQVPGVNRVVYDISSKPPATIEWE